MTDDGVPIGAVHGELLEPEGPRTHTWPMLNTQEAVDAGEDPLVNYRVFPDQVCGTCGCKQDAACKPNQLTGETCWWVHPDLCSRCAPIGERVKVATNNPMNLWQLARACAIVELNARAARDVAAVR